ncbi:MAG: hypothetical protein OXB88_11585 [Bacteriovoracales bacterium]|nr:hypothetical protein [Bacteriovoracales bacterium]
MKKNVVFLFSLVFLSSPASFALSLTDLLIEPLVGYSLSGEAKQENAASEDFDGTVFGGKIGYSFLGLSAGLRFDTGALELESGTQGTTDSDYGAYGIFVGYDLPIFLRASFTHYISSEQDIENVGVFEGTGTSIHLGFGFLPLVNLFVEYHDHKLERNGVDRDFNWYLLGLSLPLDI